MPTPPSSAPTPSQPSTPTQATPPVAQPQGAKAVPAESGMPKPVAKPLDKAQEAVAKKYKVKVDNQEREVEESELVNNYQLRQLSDKRRGEADKVLAEYQKLQEVSKKDPIKFMKAMGYDFDNLATSYLAKKAEEAMLDPKERELQAAKAEAAEYKKWVDEQKSMAEKSAAQQTFEANRAAIHQEIIQAIEEASETLGVPKDEELVIAIAQKMILQDRKQKPLNAKEALPRAYASTQKWLQGMASKMEGEAIVKWLGDDVAKKIRKYDLAQLKAKRMAAQPQSLVKPADQKSSPSAPAYKTWSQFKSETLDKIK